GNNFANEITGTNLEAGGSPAFYQLDPAAHDSGAARVCDGNRRQLRPGRTGPQADGRCQKGEQPARRRASFSRCAGGDVEARSEPAAGRR
ncbi:MAG: hypothetical protein OXH14_11265, partial [Alphaproteobacteria bacterium]|nr:hypothetical protein [Alphaproteobacteria bacterium]